MLIEIKPRKKLPLDKKLQILNRIYIDERSTISIFLNKSPDEYFKYIRLEIPKESELIGKIYVDEQEYEPQELIKELQNTYSDYIFEIKENPFREYKALEEIVFRVISKINTPDIPYKLYTTKPLSKSTFDYILDYLTFMENPNKYVLEQIDNPKNDPMYMYKKSYILLRYS